MIIFFGWTKSYKCFRKIILWHHGEEQPLRIVLKSKAFLKAKITSKFICKAKNS